MSSQEDLSRRASVTVRMRQFFSASPDKEMTGAELAELFGATKNQLNHARKKLAAAGLIETVTVTRAVSRKNRKQDQ